MQSSRYAAVRLPDAGNRDRVSAAANGRRTARICARRQFPGGITGPGARRNRAAHRGRGRRIPDQGTGPRWILKMPTAINDNSPMSPLKRALLAMKDMRARLDEVERAASEPIAII